MSGMRTLSSKLPCRPPTVIAVSLPITCAATWSTTSGMTGLTLPGMIEEPFWSSGRNSSPSPARGPEPIHARSWAIFVSETAMTFSAPDSSTSASRLPCASKGSSGGADLEAAVGLEQRAHALGELGMGVQAGAGGGAAERDLRRPAAARCAPAARRGGSAPRSPRTPGRASPGRRPSGASGRTSRCRRTPRPSRRTRPRGARARAAAGSSPRRGRRGGPRSGRRRWTTAPCSRGRSGARPRPRASR